MKFVQFSYKRRPDDIRAGYLVGDCVAELTALDTCMPKTMMGFLQNDYYWKRMHDLSSRTPLCAVPLKDVCLKAPIHGMDKILVLQVNYFDYCEKHKIDVPEVPEVVNKFPSTVVGPSDAVLLRTFATSKVDYGVALCVVMGRETSMVTSEKANSYIFGYTIAQDISARRLATDADEQLLLGSSITHSMDTFCPIGPWIVTPDEIGDLDNLNIQCRVNGLCNQNSNTRHLVHGIPNIIALISSYMTLFPGDIILTGTPSGVAMYSSPPQYLKPGNRVESEIENIGILDTTIKMYEPPERLPRHKYIRWPY